MEDYGREKRDHGTVRAPLQMPILRIELEGIKQAMLVAITNGQQDLHEAIQHQLSECLKTLTPELIMAGVRRAFGEALYEAVKEQAPELIEKAIHEYFTTGEGSTWVRQAIKAHFRL